MWNSQWKKGIDYPEWGDTEVYKKTIGGGYLYNGETPKEAYRRVAKTVARRLQKTSSTVSPLPINASTGRRLKKC